MQNFIKIAQTVAEIWRYNGFQNDGRPPSWIFKFKFFNGRVVKRPVLHQRTKFRKDRSNRCGDIAIFVIFNMAAAPPIWNFQKFELLTL